MRKCDEANDAGDNKRVRSSRQSDAQGGVFGSDGNACSVGCVLSADRTALSEGGEWTPAGGFGTDASNVLGR